MAQGTTQAIPWVWRVCPKPTSGIRRSSLGHPYSGEGGSESRSQGVDWETYKRRSGGGGGGGQAVGVGWGPPDLTLPLVEMAEMERPVMEVTVTESRMMIQVRTVGVGGAVITPNLSQCPRHVRNPGQPRDSPRDLSHFPSLSLSFFI